MLTLWQKIVSVTTLPIAMVYRMIMPRAKWLVVSADITRWASWKVLGDNLQGFSHLLGNYPEFRSLFYKRIGLLRLLSSWWLKGKTTLEITTRDIGGGLLIQHGFSTIISAERIGKNCKIYQQVTIGYNHDLKAPVIGENVEICCGAKVIGGITVGDNVLVGANAVVVTDVPPNSVVAGVPARVIRKLDHTRDLTA